MIFRLLPALVLALTLARISPALEFSGTISSSNGAPPIEELTVLVEHHENRRADNPDAFAVRQRPGKDGRFAIELPYDKKGYMVFITDTSNRMYKGFAHLNETTNLGAIAVQGGGTLTGNVQSRDHKPLANMEVILDIRLRPFTCSHYIEAARSRTDAKGALVFENLPIGEYRYRPASDTYAVQDGTLTITEDPAFLNLILDKAAWLKGKITDPQGKPIRGIRVRVQDQSTVSDAQGSYRLGGLTGGTNYVSVSGTGYVQDKKRAHESTQVICVPGEEITRDFAVVQAGVLRLTLETEVADLRLSNELKINLKTETEYGYSSSDETSAPLKDHVAVFSNMAPGDYTLTLADEALPSVSTNITIASGQEIRPTIRIPKSYLYKGLVVDEAGKPVSKVTITASPDKKQADRDESDMYLMRHDGRSKETRSDTQGAFTLKGLTAGPNRISTTHNDFMSTNFVVEIVGEMDATPTPLVLLKGLKVSGIVTDAGGKPALRHTVNLNSAPSRDAMLSGQQSIYKYSEVGTNGTFEFKGLPPGKYRLSVSDPDHNEITTLENVEAGSDDIVVTLAKTRMIMGTVVDTGGKPIPGISIQAVKSQKRDSGFYYSSPSRNATITDTNGHFEISVREGAAYDIVANAPPLLPQKTAIDLSSGTPLSAVPLKIVMALGYKISGTLVAADGKPAGKGLNVSVSQSGGMSMMMVMPNAGKSVSAETDAQGQFALDGVPPGIIILSVYDKTGDEASIRSPKILTSKEVLVDTNKATVVRIVLPKLGSIKGRVMPEEGKKAGICHVSLTSTSGEGRLNYNMQSDSQGGFSFTNIPAGKYMAMAFGRGTGRTISRVPEFIEVIADKTVDITLGPKTPIAGAVTLAGTVSKDNAPFQAGEISFMPTPKNTASQEDLMALYGKMAQGNIGSNGVFSVKSLEAGEYLCIVMPREPGKESRSDRFAYPKTYQTLVKLTTGQTNLNIRFTGITLIGKVTGQDAKPVDKAYITATPADAGKGLKQMLGHHAQTDTQGQYRVECLPPGAYDITVQHKEHGVMSRKNVMVSEKSNSVDIALASGITLTGTVSTTAGGSAEGAWIMLAADDESNGGFGMAEANGTYQMKQPVMRGTYRIFIALKGYAISAATLSLTTNTQYNATLEPGGDVRVTVRKQGEPVSGKTVRIHAADGTVVIRLSDNNPQYGSFYGNFGLTIAATDEKGQTLIRALKPGKYTVKLDGEKPSAPVDVNPLDTAEVALDL
ncbi:MAG: carboxypeptidase-like regulatory domain-containing protein [Kiritimatiellae bacterium]|nr:carboxypeptidase-like regulatory domain-containing protein [Kiritimatiellia bacterium]